MKTSYLPIDPEYFDLFEKEIEKGSVKLFYFEDENYPMLDESSGRVQKIDRNDKNEFYFFFENGDQVRADRIVVFNGIPGPAFDEYDAYALAPLTCKAGYDDDDENC